MADELKQSEIFISKKMDWRKHEPQSFEVTEYGKEKDKKDGILEKLKVIKEVVRDISLRTPAHGFQVKAGAGKLQLVFQCYEMQLAHRPRLEAVQHQAKQLLDAAVREIKSEFKARCGDTLTLKEIKDQANFDVQKVSLNERYLYTAWRVYELE
jgi:hypothetical protein